MFNSGTKLKAFGLDISDAGIKVMELGQRSHGLYPIAMAEVPLLANLITNHVIINEAKLSENIKKAVEAAKHIDTKYVVASVPESKSFVRILKLPKMSEDEIATALPFEVEQNIPVPIDLVYTDWQLIKENPDNLEILVTSTPKDYVDSLVATLKKAGLQPVALELESQAMARSLIGPADKDACVLIADISSVQTSFVIVESGNVQYTSSVPIAGTAFTESIAKNLNVSLEEAEKVKRAQGLVADIKKGNIRQAILPLLDNIIDEIKNVIRYHEEHTEKHNHVSKLIFCGGSSKLPGITDYIAARLNLGSAKSVGLVELGNAYTNIADPNKVKMPVSTLDALSFCTVAGLALRGLTT